MGETQTVLLGDAAEIIAGQSPPGFTINQSGDGIPFFQGAKDFGSRYPQVRTYTTAPTRLARPGDILLSVRAPIGRVNRCQAECAIGRGVFALRGRPEIASTDYLEYSLRAYEPRWHRHESAGSVFSNLGITELLRLELPLPPLPEQRAIAEVLGALDDKIEANRRITHLLEELLSTMFHEFGFDNIRTSRDNVELAEIVEVNPPQEKIRSDIAPYIDMAALSTNSALVAKPAYREPKSGARFVNGDTVVARITPCLENGKAAFIDCLGLGEVGTGSTEFLILRPRDHLPREFAYFLVRSERFLAYAVKHMSGSSGRQRCPAEAVERYELPRPDMDKLERFGELAHPGFALMRAALNESCSLEALRDTLLPKLMSGELRVRDAELLVEDAV